jgi:hypothetical protein
MVRFTSTRTALRLGARAISSVKGMIYVVDVQASPVFNRQCDIADTVRQGVALL